jgi:hypothetical protein
VVAAVIAGDFSRLQHSQLFSVQLQPPGTGEPTSNGQPEPVLEAGGRAGLEESYRMLLELTERGSDA